MKYAPEIEHEIDFLTENIKTDERLCHLYPPRWLAIQLLEGDLSLLKAQEPKPAVLEALHASESRLIEIFGPDLDITLPDQRFQFIQSILTNSLDRDENKETFSDKLDRILANRYLGLPIFLMVMYLVFNIVQNVAAPYLDWIDSFFNTFLTKWVTQLLTVLQTPGWLNSLLIDGVIAGVGGVLVFVPGLFAMYSLLSLMEQSGYMSRAAYVMDRFMSKIGLHGKSFIPMILGFGCNVPAVYATRTIEKRETRLLTGLLIPFMSCSARLPVYLIFGLAFFPKNANTVIFILYLLGVLVAAGIALLVSRLIFHEKNSSIMILELPAYQPPGLKQMLKYSWQQTSEFIRRAGTVILGFSIILWLLLNLPWGVTDPHDSYYGQFSEFLAPTLAPPGFGNWEASGALVSGLVAKELVVSSFSQIYGITDNLDHQEADQTTFLEDLSQLTTDLGTASVNSGKALLDALTPGITLFKTDENSGEGDVALSHALQKAFTPLSAASFLVFVLLYVPCVATISAQRQEFGSRWAALSVGITLLLPWVMATIVYQTGSLFGLG